MNYIRQQHWALSERRAGPAHVGHQVRCVDKDEERVAALTEDWVPFYELGLEGHMQEGLRRGFDWKRWLIAMERTPPVQDAHLTVLAGKEAS